MHRAHVRRPEMRPHPRSRDRSVAERRITFVDIREVHNRKESSTFKKRRGIRDRPLTEKKITEYALEYLYKSMGTTLVACRRRSNESGFNSVLYCCVPWSKFPTRAGNNLIYLNQSTLRFVFLDPNPAAWNDTNVSELFPEASAPAATYEEMLARSQRLCSKLSCVVYHEVVIAIPKHSRQLLGWHMRCMRW